MVTKLIRIFAEIMKQSLPIFLLMLSMLFSCGDNAKELQIRSSKERLKQDSLYRKALKIAVMPTMDGLPIFLAYEHHYFDTLGVDVRLLRYKAQMDCDTALLGGSAEGSVTDLVRAERLQQKGLVLDYTIATNTYWQLYANRMARITSIAQLSDKMVAMTRYSATDMLTSIAVDSVRPKYDIYRIQINDINIRLAMLLNNEMDAMWLPEPQATVARLHGHQLLMSSEDKNIHLGIIAFRQKGMLTQHRKRQLKLFIQAYKQACDSINHYGVKHYAILIKKYCGVNDATIKALPNLSYTFKIPKSIDIIQARNWNRNH